MVTEFYDKNYATKIIKNKCLACADLGKGSVKVKLKRKYSVALVVEELVEQGFTVIENSDNGKAILTIKW